MMNQKTATALLLTPDRKLLKFGFPAREAYNDLNSRDAKNFLYFDRFKMILHHEPVGMLLPPSVSMGIIVE